MIRVHLPTLTADRTPLPANLVGLSDATLSHLQSALAPVPDDLIGYEWC